MSATYQLVLFNVDRPAVPGNAKECFCNVGEYDSLVNGWTKELQCGEGIYTVVRYRAWELKSDVFGHRHVLIIDVTKKI